MLKLFGRVVIVVLLAALLSTGIYFALNSGASSQTVGNFESGSRPALQTGTGNSQFTGAGNGFHRGEGGDENSAAAWLDVVKNLVIIAIATVGVTLIRKVAMMQKKVTSIAGQ
jgi:hypothetical protein